MAATLTADQQLTYFSFPIEKVEDAGDGTVEVVGKATDGTLDSDLQIVDPEWSAKAIREWYATGANVRVQHNAQRDPAGKGIHVDGHTVRARVVEPVAVKLVKAGVLQDFSVGIMNPDIRRGDPKFKHLDPMGKAVNGVITGRDDGMSKIGEISLVDRGSNFGTRFAMMKAAGANGAPEWVGELTASDDVLAKIGATDVLTKDAKPAKAKTVTVELPKNMSVSIKPSDLAKLAALRPVLARENALAKAAAPVVTKAVTDEPDPELEALKAIGAAEDAVLGKDHREFSADERREQASAGNSLPDGSYPIPDADALRRAAILARSKHGNWKAARKLIARRAAELKVPNPLKGGKAKVAAAGTAKGDGNLGDCPTCKGRGYVKKPGNMKCEACGGSGKATGKTAEPDVAKCGCDAGMMDGKPCTKCKAGKKAAAKAEKSAGPKMTKKKKVMCGSCGARQNRKHNMCSECGKDLAGAIPVMKNHAYTCLGCGKDLDKGEKHCPGCGKENPGYLPEADHQIPANRAAEKAKKPKPKKGKGKPFGGSEAPPFGAKDKDTDDDSAGKAARVIKGKKGKKGKPGKETPGSAGGVPGQHETPVPPHRDAATEETFERPGAKEASAAPLSNDPEMAAAMTLKTLGVPAHLGALHALTCPAYAPESVAKAFPSASFAGIDAAEWMNEAASKAASAPLDQAQDAMALWHAANALRNADPYLLADLRTAAHKAFRDANPGPGTFPEPSEIGPGRFQRPYIGAGHAAASPDHGAPHSAKLPEVGGINAQDHTRGYLSAGHAAESPESAAHPAPMTTPAHTGVPTSAPGQAYVSTTATEGASHALNAMHDHISRVFPDICPMQDSLHIASHPVPVPHGVPSPSTAGAARKAAKKAAAARKAAKAKARKAALAKRRKLQRKVFKGRISVNQAREKLGLKPCPPELTKAATAAPTAPEETPPVAAAVDPEAFTAAVTKATRPLLKRLDRQDKALKAVRKTADAIASQPDTTGAPFRGVALPKSSAAPAGPLSTSGIAEQFQLNKIRLLHDEWRNSPSGERREAAYHELEQLLGRPPMNAPPT